MTPIAPADQTLAHGAVSRAVDSPTPRPTLPISIRHGAHTLIEPPTRWPGIDFRELWKYRELLYYFVWRDVKVRYKQTVLGIAWAVLQPAMLMVVFTIFFHKIAGIDTAGLPAPLFYLSGLLPWFYFQQSVSASGGSVVGSEHLITKIFFPRLLIPIGSVLAATFDSLIAFGLLAVMWVYYALDGQLSTIPNENLLALPLVYLVIGMLSVGVGTLISALNVVYRDFRYIVPFALQLGLFATPTIYKTLEGHEGRTFTMLAEINPMTGLVSSYRAATLGTPMPWEDFGIAAAVAVGFLIVGSLYFRKTEDRFADII